MKNIHNFSRFQDLANKVQLYFYLIILLDTITQLHKSRHGWMLTESYREHDSGL